MKSLFFILVATCCIGFSVKAQEVDFYQARAFWSSNVLPIIDGRLEMVVKQVNFPLTTYLGEWTEEQFRANYATLFDDESIEDLSSQDFTNMKIVEDENGFSYLVGIIKLREIDRQLFSNMTVLYFRKFDCDWKLYRVDLEE